MQILTPSTVRERVGFVVPRWTVSDPELVRQGVPFRCFPVAGALFNHGYEVVYFDQELDLDLHDRLEDLEKALAPCRVVFMWTNELWPVTQYNNLCLLIPRIKAWYPEITIVVGGAFVNVCPEEMFRVEGPVDFFIRGTGEHVGPELLKALDEKTGLEEISGLTWRENGVHRQNPVTGSQRLLPENNEVLYRLLDLKEYIQHGGIFGNDQGTLIINTGQGCAKKCGFCFWRGYQPSLLRAEALVDLIAQLRERYGVRQYHLAELDFFTARSRALDFAEAWQRKLPDSIWFALVSPEDIMRFTDEELDRLRDGGCRKLEIGSESGSARMLKFLGKNHAPEDTVVLHRRLKDRGIYTLYNFIFGFPGETAADRRDSMRQIQELFEMEPLLVSFAFRLFQPTPGTPIGDETLKSVLDFPKTLDELNSYRAFYSDYSARTMPWMDERDETVIKRVLQYTLPMATSRLPCPDKRTEILYRILRKIAQWRLRHGFWAGRWDERFYRWFLGRTLSETYRP